MNRLAGRQTGRTTRMVDEAIRASLQFNLAVYIVAANPSEVTRIKRVLSMRCPEWESLGIKVETPPQLSNFDWETLTLRGAWPTVKVLVDHHAIEQRYANVLEELHRYDASPREEFEALYHGRFDPGPAEAVGDWNRDRAKKAVTWSEPQDPKTWGTDADS